MNLKLFLLSLLLMMCQFMLAQTSTAKWIVNDTMEGRLINGIEKFTIYKDASGATLTLQEKDSFIKHFPTLGFSIKSGNPMQIIFSSTSDVLINAPAPAIALQTLDGKTIAPSDYLGSVVVLNFWFTACLPCVQEMPLLNKLTGEYKDKGVVFIAVASDNEEEVKKFLMNKSFLYKQTVSKKAVNRLGISVFPTHIIIDKKGVIRKIEVGTGLESLQKTLKESIDNFLIQ